MGILDAPAKPQAARIPLTTRTSSYNSGFSTAAVGATVKTFRRSMRVVTSGSDLVLTFGNWANVNGTRTDGPNAITVTASLQLPDGTPLVPLYFRGARAVAIDPGGVATADSLPVEIIAGTVVQVLTSVSVPDGGKWPLGLAATGTIGDSLLTITGTPDGIHPPNNEGEGTGDVTVTPGNTTGTTGGFGYGPQSLVGYPKPGVAVPRTWIIAGDSYTVGGGDNAQDIGYVYRWLLTNGPYGYFIVGAGNSNATYLLGNSGRAPMTPIVAGSVTDCWLAHGTNDRLGSTSDRTNYQQRLISEALRFSSRKIRVYVPTIAPRTSSTDNWVTAANQTPLANESDRLTWNAWIRAGLPINATTLAPVTVGTSGALLAGQAGHPVALWLELADLIESARDSGAWRGAGRTVTDAAMTSGSTTLTSASAAFTAADVGKSVRILGAGSAGGALATNIASVTNATTAVLGGGAGTTASGATAYIDVLTTDGVHPSQGGHLRIVAGLPTPASL